MFIKKKLEIRQNKSFDQRSSVIMGGGSPTWQSLRFPQIRDKQIRNQWISIHHHPLVSTAFWKRCKNIASMKYWSWSRIALWIQASCDRTVVDNQRDGTCLQCWNGWHPRKAIFSQPLTSSGRSRNWHFTLRLSSLLGKTGSGTMKS